MSFDGCFTDIGKILNRELTKNEKAEIKEKLSDFIQKRRESPNGEDIRAQIDKDIDNYVKDLKTTALIEKRITIQNKIKQIEIESYLDSTWSDNYVEGLNAILGGSVVNRPGARNSASSAITSLQDKYADAVQSELSKLGLLDVAFNNPQMDEHIAKAMHLLSFRNIDERALAKLPQEARDIAKVFLKYQEIARKKANQAGSWIGKLEGRFQKRTHDALKIKKAGGDDIPANSPKHKQAWLEFISQKLDFEGTFPGLPRSKANEYLSDMYEQFANGYHIDFKDSRVDSPSFSPISNIGKKLSHDRVLKFKDFEGEWAYYKRFSNDGSLGENIMQELSGLARDTALMQKFGPNAQNNIKVIKDRTVQKLTKEGKGDKATEFDQAFKRQVGDASNHGSLWASLTGSMNRPDSDQAKKWATIMSNVRSVQGVGDLAAAMLTQMSDIVLGASNYRYTGDRSFGSFLEGFTTQAKGIITRLGKGIKEDERTIASELSIFLDAISSTPTRFMADPNEVGRTTKFIDSLYKYTGLQHWQDRSRLAGVMGASHRLFKNMSKSFDELPAGMKDFFSQHSITQKEWDLFRSGSLSVDSSGREFLTLKAIQEADLSSFKKLDGVSEKIKKAINGKDPEKVKAIEERVLNSVKDETLKKFTNMFSDYAYTTAMEPSHSDRAFMMGGSKAGTFAGEVKRSFWQYKSFTVAVTRKVIGRELYGYNSEVVSLPKAVKRMFTPGNNANSGAAGMATMIALGLPIGYLSMSLKDLSKGKEPRVPSNPEQAVKITMAAMAQTGALGIYSDFLFGDMKNRFGQDVLTSILGPTAGRAKDTLSLLMNTKSTIIDAITTENDDFGKLGAEYYNFLLSNTPGVNTLKNHFMTRAAMDYLILYRMKEMMNPGYLQRMEKRIKKENDQEFIVPPSQVIPRGGF
jgi:hypothetical protein